MTPGADSSDVPDDVSRRSVMRVCVDARARSSGHARRGIGTYVDAMQAALASAEGVHEAAEDIELRFLTADDGTALLRQSHWDVYHATTLEGIILSPAFRTVATLYDLIPLCLPDWCWRARHPLAALAYQRQLDLLPRADHIIAISEATKRDAQALLGIPAERVTVVYPALDPRRGCVPSTAQVEAASAALGLQAPYFLAVGSSDRHKNLSRVIDAFAAFREHAPGPTAHRLYIAGTWMGREGRRLRRLIAQLGLDSTVCHLPWVPVEHMAPLYHGATALVFPSLAEGFGLPVLEAMASATPVITSNRSSLPEVAGDAALYVTPEDVAEIAGALTLVAGEPNLRAELAGRGLKRSQQFSAEATASQLVSVYRQVACAHPGDGRRGERR